MEEGWELQVLIVDLQVTRRLLVKGDTHIGGVMLTLTESIQVKTDWSDHALWWPSRKRWLLKMRCTLDSAGVQRGTELEFHRVHGSVRIQLPDLQERFVRVNFAQSVFSVVVATCRELSIRHPEELSLRRIPSRQVSAASNGTFGTLGSRFSSFRRSKSAKGSSQMEISGPVTNGSPSPLARQTSHASSRSARSEVPPKTSPISIHSFTVEGVELANMVNSPELSTQEAFAEKCVPKPRSLMERAEINEGWLDSSRSLMEQDVRPYDGNLEDQGCLQLRFKFHAFYDLSAKLDSVRINQIFEQLKWSVLSEELDASEEETLLLAALQLQIRQTAGNATTANASSPRGPESSTIGKKFQFDSPDTRQEVTDARNNGTADDDDIDAALAELEASLMSGATRPKHPNQQQMPSLHKIPELAGFFQFLKPRKHTLRGFRKYYFVLREAQLTMFADQARSQPLETFSLLSSEVTSEAKATAKKFCIRLLVPDSATEKGKMQELWLRCESRDQFSEWSAGLSLAARGKTLASRAEFEAESKATSQQLELQAPKPQPRLTQDVASSDIDPTDFVPPRLQKARKPRWLLQRILERHVNVRDKTSLEAKLDYIKICQRLSTYGIAYFVVQYFNDELSMKFSESRKTARVKELLGVGPNRLFRVNLASGKIVNAWRLEELESWTVNWDLFSLQLQISRPPHSLVLAPCPSLPFHKRRESLCKTLAEFIGGSVFLSLRNPEKSQELDERLFHKLTAHREPNDYC